MNKITFLKHFSAHSTGRRPQGRRTRYEEEQDNVAEDRLAFASCHHDPPRVSDSRQIEGWMEITSFH